ncbi:MAG: aminotransferase class I/II-fold pyridoxal phosphate-dependent enzyme [Blautia sp.]|nr:aminotransferase class I/II-fold pyridoxal phosphate-dependent enzyme [Lachnospiraceae bacterium]MBP3901393.1 aminotransferase class I/II-fold pyridoxal phosphate-dependent enzyme [Blautia sp.]
MREKTLYSELLHYDEKDIYPFHMPGHKRNPTFSAGFFPVAQDITEITGFDDLHHAEGIIKEAQEYAAQLYGSRRVFFSVNGSTACILAAVSAAVKNGEKILAARNSHKSFYHAMYLRNLDPVYIYPEIDEETGISGSILPFEVEKLLEENEGVEAVFITSPTYDGVVSDVRKIAEIVHRYGVPLIVDEAHGAHFAFSDYFPESAVNLGADAVIHSIHKTLPAMTQTAVLHLCSDRIPEDRIVRFMSIYQTSSPSYPLMASLDRCFRFLGSEGKGCFREYAERLERWRNRLGEFNNIRLLHFVTSFEGGEKFYDFDRSKILLSTSSAGMRGNRFLKILHEEYGVELEMAASDYVTALTSPLDTEEGFERLYRAVREIDRAAVNVDFKRENVCRFIEERPVKILNPSEALEGKTVTVRLNESIGKISAEFMYIYPPGIPLLVPGEQISLQFVQNMRRYIAEEMNVSGLKDCTGEYIDCVL